MTKEELYKNFKKLEDYFYHHTKENYTYEGFTFVKGEYYRIDDDEDGTYIWDDNGNCYDIYDMDKDSISFN